MSTFWVSLSTASFWPAYLAAMSLNAGPTTFFCTVWQLMQFFFWASSGLASAGVLRQAPATAAIEIARETADDFMISLRVVRPR